MSEALEEITQIALWLRADSLADAASFVLAHKEHYNLKTIKLAEKLTETTKGDKYEAE